MGQSRQEFWRSDHARIADLGQGQLDWISLRRTSDKGNSEATPQGQPPPPVFLEVEDKVRCLLLDRHGAGCIDRALIDLIVLARGDQVVKAHQALGMNPGAVTRRTRQVYGEPVKQPKEPYKTRFSLPIIQTADLQPVVGRYFSRLQYCVTELAISLGGPCQSKLA